MVAVIDIEPIRERFSAVAPFLDERGRRLVAAAEASAAGYGGIAAVAMATGVAPSTIGRGLKELAQDEPPASARAGSPPRIRRPGAGRQRTIFKDPRLLPDLEALVEPTTRGDPQSPLRWTCKSVRRLAPALHAQGHEVSRTLVAHLLNQAGYSLQANRKTTEGDSHPDRDAQFGYINTQVTTALAEQQPVISVDTKNKELVGDFRNNGREYRQQVEQNRTPALLLHQSELARQAARQLQGHRRIDLGHHNQNRPHRALRTRHQPISQRHCRIGCRHGRHQHQTRRVPWRLELHNLSKRSSPQSRVNLVTDPKNET